MPSAGWQLGPIQIAGLVAAGAALALGLWVLRRSRRHAEDQRVHLPVLGVVGVPTSLTVGVCLLASAYHAAAYSLAPRVNLVAVPIDRWWILACVVVFAVGGSLIADRLESRASDRGG